MKMKNNASLYTHDPMLIRVYDADEVISLFGEDYLEDYGVVMPEELLARYKRAWKELMIVQDELEKLKKVQGERY